MKYKVLYAKAYKKAIKNLRSKELQTLESIIDKLAKGERLETRHNDHKLQGEFTGFRECHIKPDLLLIYQKQEDILILTCINVGSHSTIFKS